MNAPLEDALNYKPNKLTAKNFCATVLIKITNTIAGIKVPNEKLMYFSTQEPI